MNAALRQLRPTFVQVPDRFLGALSNARGKVLEVVQEARASGGNDTQELKALLLLDALLLSQGRSGETCGALLEERLSWWWGGQWAALWCSATGGSKAPPATRGANDDKARAKRV